MVLFESVFYSVIQPSVWVCSECENLMNSVTCHLPHEFIADENILAQIGEDSQEDRKFFYDQQQSGKKNSSEEKF